MIHPLEQLRDDALREIDSASEEQALEAARIKFLGKSGSISAWGERMKTLGKDEKPIVGKLLNEVRNTVTVALESRATVTVLRTSLSNLPTIGFSSLPSVFIRSP